MLIKINKHNNKKSSSSSRNCFVGSALFVVVVVVSEVKLARRWSAALPASLCLSRCLCCCCCLCLSYKCQPVQTRHIHVRPAKMPSNSGDDDDDGGQLAGQQQLLLLGGRGWCTASATDWELELRRRLGLVALLPCLAGSFELQKEPISISIL